MKPEKKTEIILFNWLRPYVSEIYFNSKNILNAPVFKVKSENTRKIPDLIIKSKYGKYIAVEVKPTESGRHIKTGSKQLIERYWIPYAIGKVQYMIEGSVIEIDKFIIATNLHLPHLYQ